MRSLVSIIQFCFLQCLLIFTNTTAHYNNDAADTASQKRKLQYTDISESSSVGFRGDVNRGTEIRIGNVGGTQGFGSTADGLTNDVVVNIRNVGGTGGAGSQRGTFAPSASYFSGDSADNFDKNQPNILARGNTGVSRGSVVIDSVGKNLNTSPDSLITYAPSQTIKYEPTPAPPLAPAADETIIVFTPSPKYAIPPDQVVPTFSPLPVKPAADETMMVFTPSPKYAIAPDQVAPTHSPLPVEPAADVSINVFTPSSPYFILPDKVVPTPTPLVPPAEDETILVIDQVVPTAPPIPQPAADENTLVFTASPTLAVDPDKFVPAPLPPSTNEPLVAITKSQQDGVVAQTQKPTVLPAQDEIIQNFTPSPTYIVAADGSTEVGEADDPDATAFSADVFSPPVLPSVSRKNTRCSVGVYDESKDACKATKSLPWCGQWSTYDCYESSTANGIMSEWVCDDGSPLCLAEFHVCPKGWSYRQSACLRDAKILPPSVIGTCSSSSVAGAQQPARCQILKRYCANGVVRGLGVGIPVDGTVDGEYPVCRRVVQWLPSNTN
eukprot:GHVL01022729.1.p1 GENE.GHVL01022729.1~~GHVL01022729.1.p1  ORF type:complete len:553 (+),score=83.55 GHVL01022729.1:93-1751(+)